MPRTLLIATNNPDKANELKQLFADLPLSVVCAADMQDAPEVVEDGATLEENALKKAREMSFHYNLLCIADDTGLEVDALDGAPGVYSARYAGEAATYQDNCEKLIGALAGVDPEHRSARFRTVMALVDPSGQPGPVERTVSGALEGQILESPRGTGGFGYDPVFFVPEAGCTLAEMTSEAKNAISHRARASASMRDVLAGWLS